MTIHIAAFRSLDGARLYDMLQLRSEVFVVEQNCVYQDLDGIDKVCSEEFLEDGIPHVKMEREV